MPRTSVSDPHPERIDDIDLTAEMQDSFLEYAYSVIYSRALPDARDGLKPVQRRILYQMAEMGLRPDRGHVKSARVVGEVMGKLHPHGDTAIYDALVRLAQDFALRLPLVDGHGNFGSLDDGPAASRYTEARLAASALALTENLDEDVVDFVPNYDGQFQQPAVLSAAFPNLLVNGATGIAVGMATNMAPHNLIEVVAAAQHLLENPEATVEDLMAFVPGPDFPMGGVIAGLDGIADAYRTGRGSVRVRGKVAIAPLGPRKTGITITELPYMVGPERVIEKIRDAVQSKKLQGISDVEDLSDRHNKLKIIITVKSGFDAQAVLEQLYRLTPLEDSFSFNNVALVHGQPKTLGLKELLQVYVDHRLEVVTRRSRYRLARRLERLHLVDGLLLAIADIDEVIALIRSSDDSSQARNRLCTVFDLSTTQAEYILELRLRRLTRFSKIELEDEKKSLQEEIAKLEELLASDVSLRAQVSTELDEASNRYGTARRTLLLHGQTPVRTRSKTPVILEIADGQTAVALSTTGRLARVDYTDSTGLNAPLRRSAHDALITLVPATIRGTVGALLATGQVVQFSPVDLPSLPLSSVQMSGGVPAQDYIGLPNKSDKIIGLIDLTDSTPWAVGTRLGTVKRFIPADLPLKPITEVISLKGQDELVGGARAPDTSEVIFITSGAQLLRFGADTVRPQGAAAGGMAGIKLTSGAEVIFFGAANSAQDAVVVTVSSAEEVLDGMDYGRLKVSDFSDYPPKGRSTSGVRTHTFLKSEDRLILAWAGNTPALAVGPSGKVRELPEARAKRDASGELLTDQISSVGLSLQFPG